MQGKVDLVLILSQKFVVLLEGKNARELGIAYFNMFQSLVAWIHTHDLHHDNILKFGVGRLCIFAWLHLYFHNEKNNVI